MNFYVRSSVDFRCSTVDSASFSETTFFIHSLPGKAFAICISVFLWEVGESEFRLISRNILV